MNKNKEALDASLKTLISDIKDVIKESEKQHKKSMADMTAIRTRAERLIEQSRGAIMECEFQTKRAADPLFDYLVSDLDEDDCLYLEEEEK